MKRKTSIVGFLALLVGICIGLPLLQTYRVYRQERLKMETWKSSVIYCKRERMSMPNVGGIVPP